MRRFAAKSNGRGTCRPCLVRDVAKLLAVNRICKLCSPALDVKFLNAAADLFVGRECDRDIAMLDRRILFESVDHRHYLGDTRFIVRTEQRRAVRRDDVVAVQILQIGILLDRNDLGLVVRQVRCRRPDNSCE